MIAEDSTSGAWMSPRRFDRPNNFADVAAAAERCFAGSYAASRALFLREGGRDARTYPSTAIGPDGESLATDVCWTGDPDAKAVLVIISGTHGVEGHCGAGVQIDWLNSHAAQWPQDAAAVLAIHALNPYGFAWDRRVTQEGCDLNRNFVDFRDPPANPDYDEIAALLLPPSLDQATIAAAEASLARWRARHGELRFQRARKQGQYSDPKGMFYGGAGSTEARQTLERIARDYRLAERDFVTVLDVHTGLGPYGYGETQSEHPPASQSHRIAGEVFGGALTSTLLGTSASVALNGTMAQFWEDMNGDGRHLYICLEYGTYDQEASRIAYRLDHWHYGYGNGDPASTMGKGVRRVMRAHFDPATPDWRAMVLGRARQVIDQALGHLDGLSGAL